MLELGVTIRDALYIIFGVVAMTAAIYGISAGRKKDTGDERERLVRIDENLKETRSDVADIKAEMRHTRTTLTEHERRLIKVEEAQGTIWKRIDELRESIKNKKM